MQWVLVLMLLGTSASSGSAVSADLWFADEVSCREAASALVLEVRGKLGKHALLPACIQVRR